MAKRQAEEVFTVNTDTDTMIEQGMPEYNGEPQAALPAPFPRVLTVLFENETDNPTSRGVWLHNEGPIVLSFDPQLNLLFIDEVKDGKQKTFAVPSNRVKHMKLER